MTSRCQHGCGMGLTVTARDEQFCPTDSASSGFQQTPLHACLNHSDASIDPRPAGFLFPSPVPPPPLTFASPRPYASVTVPWLYPTWITMPSRLMNRYRNALVEPEPSPFREHEVTAMEAGAAAPIDSGHG